MSVAANSKAADKSVASSSGADAGSLRRASSEGLYDKRLASSDNDRHALGVVAAKVSLRCLLSVWVSMLAETSRRRTTAASVVFVSHRGPASARQSGATRISVRSRVHIAPLAAPASAQVNAVLRTMEEESQRGSERETPAGRNQTSAGDQIAAAASSSLPAGSASSLATSSTRRQCPLSNAKS